MTDQANNTKQQIIERRKVLDDTAVYRYGREEVSVASMRKAKYVAFVRVKYNPDYATNRYYTEDELPLLHETVCQALFMSAELGVVYLNWTGTHDLITVS